MERTPTGAPLAERSLRLAGADSDGIQAREQPPYGGTHLAWPDVEVVRDAEERGLQSGLRRFGPAARLRTRGQAFRVPEVPSGRYHA